MSRQKSGDSSQGKPVDLPGWWLQEADRLRGETPLAALGEKLATAVRRPTPWHRTTVSDFLSGKLTTVEMMGAFLELYKDLPPPVIWASSIEEAQVLRGVHGAFKARAPYVADPKVPQTIEDTGEQSLSAAARDDSPRRVSARSRKR